MTLAGAPTTAHPDENARRLAAGYPSGALAEFTVTGPWSGTKDGTARLVRFLAPRDLVAS